MRIFKHPLLLLVLRWALAGVFIYAGTRKMLGPQEFADSIATFAILPNTLVNLLALGLPPFEILAGLGIVFGIQRRAALAGLTALTVIFIAALASAIFRGLPVDCGCFGSGKPSVSGAWIALGRDLLILAAAGWLYLCELGEKVGVNEMEDPQPCDCEQVPG